jgi:hypothetical protein
MSYQVDEGTGGYTRSRSERSMGIVDLQEVTSANLPIGYEKTTDKSGISAIETVRRERSYDAQVGRRPRSNPALRDAIRRALNAAQTCALQLIETVTEGDRIELANLGFYMRDTLNDLWKWRNDQENDWGDLLNMLQSALAQEEFEKFSEVQCRAIHTIVTEYLTMGGVDEDDIAATALLLQKVGFDPWKTISAESADDDDK